MRIHNDMSTDKNQRNKQVIRENGSVWQTGVDLVLALGCVRAGPVASAPASAARVD